MDEVASVAALQEAAVALPGAARRETQRLVGERRVTRRVVAVDATQVLGASVPWPA